jgi:hypothetical protein
VHICETDCVAGVVGLELRNPLGSKSARIAGEFLPIWPKRRSRDSSRPSCGIANVQLQQGFCVVRLGSGGGFADVLEDLRGRDPKALAQAPRGLLVATRNWPRYSATFSAGARLRRLRGRA